MAEDRRRRVAASKKTQTTQEKRNSTSKRRAFRKNIYIGVPIIILAVILILFIFPRNSDDSLGRSVELLTGIHSPPYLYNSSPPTSGNHLTVPSRYGFMGDALVPEAAVHNMEHGAVVIWYKPNDPQLAGSINRLIMDLGPRCLVAGSYSGSLEYDLAATVWGRILELPTYDELVLKNFIETYKGKNGPEAPFCQTESLNPSLMN